MDFERYQKIKISHLYTYLAEKRSKKKKSKQEPSEESEAKNLIESHKMSTYYLISLILR